MLKMKVIGKYIEDHKNQALDAPTGLPSTDREMCTVALKFLTPHTAKPMG